MEKIRAIYKKEDMYMPYMGVVVILHAMGLATSPRRWRLLALPVLASLLGLLVQLVLSELLLPDIHSGRPVPGLSKQFGPRHVPHLLHLPKTHLGIFCLLLAVHGESLLHDLTLPGASVLLLHAPLHHVEVGERLPAQALLCLQHPVWQQRISVRTLWPF